MEIHNSPLSNIRETVNNTKSKSANPQINKDIDTEAVNVLETYGRAQVNNCTFKGDNTESVVIPKEKRLNFIKALGIKNPEDIKKLLNYSGIQFYIISAFLFAGCDLNSIDESIKSNIENVKKDDDVLDILDEDSFEFIKKAKGFIIDNPQDTINFVNKIRSLYGKEDYVPEVLASMLLFLDENNVNFANELINSSNNKFNLNYFSLFLLHYNEKTAKFIRKLVFEENKELSAEDIAEICEKIYPDNVDMAEQLIYGDNQRYSIKDKVKILSGADKNTIDSIKKILNDKTLKYNDSELASVISAFNKNNLPIAEELLYNHSEGLTDKDIKKILVFVNEENKDFALQLVKNMDDIQVDGDNTKYISNINFEEYENVNQIRAQYISDILYSSNGGVLDFVKTLVLENQDYNIQEKANIITPLDEKNYILVQRLLNLPKEKKVDTELISSIGYMVSDSDVKINFANYLIDLYEKEEINLKEYSRLISDAEKENVDLLKMFLDMPKETRYTPYGISNIFNIIKDYDTDQYDKCKTEMLKQLIQLKKDLNEYDIISIIERATPEKLELIKEIKSLPNGMFTDNEISQILNKYFQSDINEEGIKEAQKLIKLLREGEMPKNYFLVILSKTNTISIRDLKQVEYIIGKEKTKSFSQNDLTFAAEFKDICGKENINEIPITKKKDILRKLVANNIGLFDISDELKQYFPLLPKNQEEYCALLPALVRSLGIETNTLSDEDVSVFNTSLISLSDTLKNISDSEYAKIQISQEYPKSEFIKDTFSIVKDLSPQERQKVYDYFGFELHHNPNGIKVDDNPKHSFSITGYPVNLNNGKKLAQITNPNTKAVVEELREKVIKFSQNNRILCNNSQIQLMLNNIVKTFPELRTQIERVQHGAHVYDVMKHSLKVMQKIVQNPEFDKLSEADKKVMLICALLHDGNKAEGFKDKIHAEESAFDAFYIINKLNLPKEEKIKIYSLIKHHEWLGYVNNNKLYTLPVDKKQQSVAFDLQYDNLFDMAKLFTIADLKSVKKDDEFYIKFKNDFETHSKEIDAYIKELKKSQPLMPVTKIPRASRIEKSITKVNQDGSTNLKGVYKDKNGMVIIKYNEVENDTWERIGFPKGSISRGIDAMGFSSVNGELKLTEDVNTGNIKFFVHGLDYSNQLAKFDAFALPDSDALLSVSYAERPESKYRFFRLQGVLLNTPTKYMHGGGETDAGSGCGKNLDIFKQDYIFGGYRESDRKYISNLIKEALNMSDEEYIKFVKQNADKPFTSIEPEEVRNTIIKAFSTINSNTRRGNRAYNEMYITNPEVMGVFAYSPVDNVGDIMQFIDNQPKFLKQYALEKDLPFVVFGD